MRMDGPAFPRGAVAAAYSARAAEYATLFGSVEQLEDADRRAIHRWALGLDGPILDAGCGPGHWTDYLQRQGCQVGGLDLVPEFVRGARERFPTVDYAVASMRALPVRDGSLGGILAWYSLIHLPPEDVPGIFEEFSRVLRPDGRIMVGFFTGPRCEPFDHAITTAYYWPLEELADRCKDVGFIVEHSSVRRTPGVRAHGQLIARKGWAGNRHTRLGIASTTGGRRPLSGA